MLYLPKPARVSLPTSVPLLLMTNLEKVFNPHWPLLTNSDAAAFFKELVWGKTLLANIQYTEGEDSETVYHISLGDEETKTNINGALVIQGLARVESRRQTRIVNKDFVSTSYLPLSSFKYNVLQQEENKAKAGRLCIWQYGTIPDSDEDRQWANMLK